MVCTLQRHLDPLDLEIVERALQSVSEVIKAGSPPADLESDEELELALRRELVEMVRASGVSDADLLLDFLITGMSGKIGGDTGPTTPNLMSARSAIESQTCLPTRHGS